MIVFSDDALDDIVRLRSFLDQVDPGAARRALTQILRAIALLQDFPDRGRRKGRRHSADHHPVRRLGICRTLRHHF
jgi:plasmid stabilization system protein ParE